MDWLSATGTFAKIVAILLAVLVLVLFYEPKSRLKLTSSTPHDSAPVMGTYKKR